ADLSASWPGARHEFRTPSSRQRVHELVSRQMQRSEFTAERQHTVCARRRVDASLKQISAEYKVRVGCGAFDIADTRRPGACGRSDLQSGWNRMKATTKTTR